MKRNERFLSDLVFYRTYAATKPNGMKETWEECVERYFTMMEKKYADKLDVLKDDLELSKRVVKDKRAIPSMRALQFAGTPIERENARMYNCGATAMTSFSDFADIAYLSACGVGVGFSVQKRHIKKLPTISASKVCWEEFIIWDNKESWADSFKKLLENPDVVFDYTFIRPKGSPLSTGGTASGPEVLEEAHKAIRAILQKRRGKRLRDIDVFDIVCHIADCIVAGGVRRSALICLFDANSSRMLKAKAGDWWTANPQRARANISAVIHRKDPLKRFKYNRVMKALFKAGTGEPGVFWTNNYSMLTNPCVTGDTTVITKSGLRPISELVGVPTEIWNGFEWSEVTPQITGQDQPILKITFSDGRELKCTRYHRFSIATDYQGGAIEKEAQSLKLGDKLIKCDFPVIEGGETPTFNAYAQGFKSAEGMDGYKFITVYSPKYMCLSRLAPSKCSEQPKYNRTQVFGVDAPFAKAFIPFNLNVKGRLDWLAGLFDGDGCELKEGGFQLVSVDRAFLKNTQDLLSTLGVQSKIVHAAEEELRSLPNGAGGTQLYKCKETHRICIGSRQMQHLKTLGMRCERLKFDKSPQRDASQFVKVVKIEEAGCADYVYCFNESKRHMGVFNGVITKNCGEIALHDGQTCNLSEINLNPDKCSSVKDLFEAAHVASFLGTLQAGFTDFHYIQDKWKKNCERDALIGVSLTGLAECVIMPLRSMLYAAANFVNIYNRDTAKLIGINPSARCTAVKPSGSASLFLGTSSGVLPFHARSYIRRVIIEKNNPIAQYLALHYPSILQDSVNARDSYVIEIPIVKEGMVRREVSAIDLLNKVANLYEDWIKTGHRSGANTHNVSCTISYTPEERGEITKWMWENRNKYQGIALLPEDTGSYEQTPFEEIPMAQALQMVEEFPDIDLSQVVFGEIDERTNTIACEGPLCQLPLKN